MTVTFTGIRNASCVNYKSDIFPKAKSYIFNTQLKDDDFGNDLTAYKNLIERFPGFKNPFYSNFINIIQHDINGVKTLQINGTHVPETDEFLPLYSFVAKLTKKISKMQEKDFIHDTKYLNSEFADKALLMGKPISKDTQPYDEKWLQKLHDPKSLKKSANKIFNEIQTEMIEYLA